MTTPILYIGNKNYSSWSMRPWLVLTHADIAFEERLIRLDAPETRDEIAAVSLMGTVPALDAGHLRLFDSLAICEWAADQRPNAHLWPHDPQCRALARNAAAAMHAGFAALRRDFPMNLKRRTEPRRAEGQAALDITRVTAIWRRHRERNEAMGPFLFGAWGIVDAFYTPVATRFRTYGLHLDQISQAYCDALLSHPAFVAWEEAALREPWANKATDQL